jgi:metal-responsive CopG/Arc/MetJ family transcriptional regulator
MKLTSINFDDDLYSAIDELRKGTHKSRSRIVCELLRENPKVWEHLKPPTPATNGFRNAYGESRPAEMKK